MNKEETTCEIPNNQIKISENRDEECLIWISNKAINMANKIDELQQENKQLKDNWNKLKEMLPNVSKHYKNQFQLFSANCCEHILEIMQELESGDSDE